MVGRQKAGAGEPADELHEIELDGITRDYDPGLGIEVYTVQFDCDGPSGSASGTVEVTAEEATTTEIVPLAMGRLHRLFAALAKQTASWLTDKA